MRRNDEFGNLARSFNRMASTLHQTTTSVELLKDEVNHRKEIAKALKASEDKYRRLTENAKDVIYRMSVPDGLYEYISPATIDLFGYLPEEFYESPLLIKKIIHPTWTNYFEEQWENLISGNMPPFYEYQIIHKSGEIRWMHQRNVLIRDENEKPVTIESIVTDITKRKLTEVALKESERRFREMSDLLPNIICEMDLNLGLTYINKLGLETSGYTQDEFDAGINVMDLIYPDDRKKAATHIEQIANGVEVGPIEYRMIKKDGSELIVLVNASPIDEDGQISAIRASITDMTVQKRFQNQLQETHKMEAIGSLAGGIAHQFNNALYAITGNIDLLKIDFPSDENVANYTQIMKDSTYRMTQLTAQLLAYARGGKYQTKIILLSDFVKVTLPLVKHTIDSAINEDTDLPGDIFNVNADLTQMQMVLSAVLANSSEAIDGEGHIRIACRNKIITDEAVVDFPGLKTGNYACLTVTDNGKGMDEETKSRVFEPFFTTKFEGRGLGMAAAFGIVKNHDGWISVDSKLGKGTTVKIYLPAIESVQARPAGLPAFETPVKEDAKPKSELIKGAGTILVIDDEEAVMNVSRVMLERMGYRVLEARTGQEAIDVVKTFDGNIDLAMLDILLPGMGGEIIYPLLMKARPDLKVIIFSGYSIDGPAQEILNAGAEDFIQKPFMMADLSEKLKKILEGE